MSDNNEFSTLIVVSVICGILVIIFTLLTYTVGYLLLLGVPAGIITVLYLMWREDPNRKENDAASSLDLAYRKTVAGTLGTLSDKDIEHYLTKHLPGYVLGTGTEGHLVHIGREILDELDIAQVVPKPPTVANSIEGGRYLDRLARIGVQTPERVREIVEHVGQALGYMARFGKSGGEDYVPVTFFMPSLKQSVEDVIQHFFEDDAFKPLQTVLQANLDDLKGVFPTKYKHDDVLEAYLSGTPLRELFNILVPFEYPQELRFSHTHIVGMPGSGKTFLIKSMIADDIEAGNTVVVIDGQEDLIREIVDFVPKDRLIYIDPTDVEYPLALNPFDIGRGALDSGTPLEREQAMTSVQELLAFVFSAFMDELTDKQNTLFEYMTLLMLKIPDATFITMLDILKPGGIAGYQQYVDKLSPMAKAFFVSEFDGPEFKSTKSEVSRRLFGLMKKPVFERMFTATRSKFNMYEEMAEPGKIIVVSTAKRLLGEKAHKLFGRLFIAQLLFATQQRAGDMRRPPTFAYIDECWEYLDQNVETLLITARKYRVGLILAHQYLKKLTPGLQSAIHGTTAIKMTGKLSGEDIPVMAKQMLTTTDMLTNNPQYTFAAYFQGIGTFPWNARQHDFDTSTSEELEEHREQMRKQYSTGKTEIPADEDLEEVEEPLPPAEDEEEAF